MRDRAPEAFGLAAAALLAAAVGIVLAGPRRAPDLRERAEEFQRIVGGLGGGSATTLASCAGGFRAPGMEDCALGTGGVPGAFPFCPHHAGPTLRR